MHTQNTNNSGNSGLFSIYDSKTSSYTPPMAFQNTEVAKRAILMMMLDNPKAPFAMFPADYVLIKLSDWNPSSGIVPVKVPENCGLLIEILSAYRAAYTSLNSENKEDNGNAGQSENDNG